MPPYTVQGASGIAKTLFDGLSGRGFNTTSKTELLFDDNWSVPLKFLTPDYDIPLVPIHMNCVVPPVPSPQRCYDFGKAVKEIIENDLPDGLRVAFMGTGGLSHSIGETTMGWIDEPFDHACIDLFRNAPDEKIASELDRMLNETGNGGAELRSWAIAHAAAGGNGFDLIDYIPMPETLIGCGLAEWKIAA